MLQGFEICSFWEHWNWLLTRMDFATDVGQPFNRACVKAFFVLRQFVYDTDLA